MKVTEHIANANGKPIISFELIPPKRGGSYQEVLDIAKDLNDKYSPPFIDVTSHKTKIDPKTGKIIHRPGTIGVCSIIQNDYTDAVPHVLCSGFSKRETEYFLIDCHVMKIRNVMALRGDEVNEHSDNDNGKPKNIYAVDLVRQISDMNQGLYLDGLSTKEKTDFCIGVAGYPEGHFQAPDLESDIIRLKQKIDAGASYIVTQMFLENDDFFRFRDKCRAAGITVPILAGLAITTKKSQINDYKSKYHVKHIPKYLEEKASTESDSAEADSDFRSIGIEHAFKQSEGLIKGGAEGIHYFVINNIAPVTKVLDAINYTRTH